MLLLAATLLGMFSGCSSEVTGALTMGQWLTMICQEFGMESYYQEEPYFSNIDEDNDYFTVVQACADWGIVDAKKPLDVDSKVTWKDALVTLVNAGEFLDETATEDEKVAYAIEHFDPSVRTYWMNRAIRGAKATALLVKAQDKWANKTYEKEVEEVKYADDVLDLTQGENMLDNYKVLEDGVVAIPVTEDISIEEGQIYCLPANDDNDFTSAFRAESVTTDGEYIYVTNSDEDVELEDFIEDLDIESTLTPEMDEIIVTDGNGNVISNGEEVVSQFFQGSGSASVVPLGNFGSEPTVTTLADGKVKHEFEIDGVKVGFEYTLNGKFNFKASLTSANILSKKYQKAHPTQKLVFKASSEISSLSVTQEAKVKWFKLKSASVRMDYTTKTEVGVEFSGKPIEKLVAPEVQNVTAKDWQSTFVKNWTNSVWKDKNADDFKGAKTIKICSVTLKHGGVYRVCLDINFVVTAKGSVSIVITENGSKGIEYKDKKVRTIKTSDKDVDVQIKGNLEAYLSVGPTLYVTGLKKPVVGLSLKVGLGAEVALKFHVADTQGHLIQDISSSQMQGELAEMFADADVDIPAEVVVQVAESHGCTFESETSGPLKGHVDVCFDGSIYFIFRIGVNDYCYVSDLVSSSLEWEICGSKNAKLVHIHADNGQWQFGWIGKDNIDCTLDYTPFEEAEDPEETTAPTDETPDDGSGNDEIDVSSGINLADVHMTVSVGGTTTIQVTGLPKGYTTADLKWSAEDSSVAKVNGNGVVSGISEGATVITVTTKDGKYHAFCAVTVTEADSAAGGGGGGGGGGAF